MKVFILQHKEDKELFIESLPFGNSRKDIATTRNIEKSLKLYSGGSMLKVYRDMSKGEFLNLKEELSHFKKVEAEIKTVIKGKERNGIEYEQLQLI